MATSAKTNIQLAGQRNTYLHHGFQWFNGFGNTKKFSFFQNACVKEEERQWARQMKHIRRKQKRNKKRKKEKGSYVAKKEKVHNSWIYPQHWHPSTHWGQWKMNFYKHVSWHTIYDTVGIHSQLWGETRLIIQDFQVCAKQTQGTAITDYYSILRLKK